ncbi:AT-hook motif nuclear-localized protein 9-like [Nicotiana tomentosiformis]|uniref:AT-hook motif nuclear-localized protein 9-like n=1 Tax=Nicotiana tomentosiformis TaxID=4098 RepID=UPI000877F3A0
MEDMKCNGFSAQSLESNEVKPLTQIPMEESVIEDRLISNDNNNNEKGKESEVVTEEENPKPVNGQKKRGRGRPLGSGNRINLLQVLASQGGIAALTMGSEFTPAVVIVEPGEDLVEKVWSLSKINGESVCIFSATGTISKVDLGHSIGGILKCEASN